MASLDVPIIVKVEFADTYVIGYSYFSKGDGVVEYNITYVGPDAKEAWEELDALKGLLGSSTLFVTFEHWQNGNRISRTTYPAREKSHDHDLQGVPIGTQSSLPQDEP